MPADNSTPPPDAEEGVSVLQVLKEVQSGVLDARSLSPPSRQACVEHLGGEGYSAAEIAQVLRVSPRTIARDRRATAEAHAIRHDPKLAGLMAGQLVREAQLCMTRIRRVAREKTTPPGVKVDAERSCFGILNDMIQRMQSLGFVPTATQNLTAEVTHHQEVMDYDPIHLEIQRLRRIGQEVLPGPGHRQLDQNLDQLEQTTTRAQQAQQGAQVREGESDDPSA